MSEPTREIRVLHVDDDPALTEMVATFLERENDRLSVATARSAEEGMDRLAAGAFDCVVSDYDMPGRNGIEFLEAVREERPNLPFVLYTGKGSEEVASDAISAGVTDYLQKETGTGQYAVLANRIENAVSQYRSRTALEESQERLSLFVEQSPLGVLEYDEDFEIVGLNEAGEEILGYTEAELRGHTWEKLVTDASYDDVDAVTDQLAAAEGGYHSVDENVRADGERIVCEWHNRVVTDGDGDVVAVFSLFQDVTDRIEQERQLRKYEAYLEGSTDIITVIDPSGTVRYQSPSVTRVLGYEPGELVGEDGFKYVHPDDQAAAYDAFSDLVSGDAETATVEVRFRTADGEWRWLEIRGTDHLDAPEIEGIVTNNRDITERRERERDLEEVNALLSTLVGTLPVGVLAEDASRNVLAANERLFELFGLSGAPEEAVGRDCERMAREVSDLFVDPAGFRERIDRVIEAGESVREERVDLRDGRTFARSYEPIELPGGGGHLWVYRDVSGGTDPDTDAGGT
jgi:PAS domain S-box-containing protein